MQIAGVGLTSVDYSDGWTSYRTNLCYMAWMSVAGDNPDGTVSLADMREQYPDICAENVTTISEGAVAPDAAIMKYTEALIYQSSFCNIHIPTAPGQPQQFQTLNQALAYAPGTPSNLTLALSVGFANLQQTAQYFDNLESKVVTLLPKRYTSRECPAKNNNVSKQIKFKQITGLLVVLASGFGVALLFALPLFWRHRKWQKQHFKSLRSKAPWARKSRRSAKGAAEPAQNGSPTGEAKGAGP